MYSGLMKEINKIQNSNILSWEGWYCLGLITSWIFELFHDP